MRYAKMVQGTFLRRPNRFIAHVEIGGCQEVVHVKNTGRCRELLPEGAEVWCAESDNPARKTKFDLITVRKGARLINMDSQAPNAAVKQWLLGGGLGEITNLRPETTHGGSRFDFSFQRGEKTCFLEVKGVTLEHDGVCAFPDAPTERGVRHLQHLAQLAREGYETWALFVIQMEDVKYLHPNDETDPAFGKALREAAESGVRVMAVDCQVTVDSMVIGKEVPVRL
jgi:sugar fermentation stimulation protein A